MGSEETSRSDELCGTVGLTPLVAFDVMGTGFDVVVWFLSNPLEGNYSATRNNMKLVHWPLMGGLLRLVERGGALAGYGKCTVLLMMAHCSAVLICPLRVNTADLKQTGPLFRVALTSTIRYIVVYMRMYGKNWWGVTW